MDTVENSGDGRCEYSQHHIRCPLPGSVSSTTRKGGRWFCSGHSYYHYGREANDILTFNIMNYDLILHSRLCNKVVCDKCSEYSKLKI